MRAAPRNRQVSSFNKLFFSVYSCCKIVEYLWLSIVNGNGHQQETNLILFDASFSKSTDSKVNAPNSDHVRNASQ